MLIIGPTEDGKPSRSSAAASLYARDMRNESCRIQVLNPGYRINEREGQEVTNKAANRYTSYYRGLNNVVKRITQAIARGSPPLSSCQEESRRTIYRYFRGSFIPQCDPDGRYRPYQCHNSYCFCVSSNRGHEVIATRIHTRYGRPICIFSPPPRSLLSIEISPCQRERTKGILGQKMCRPDGSYEDVQCNPINEDCWCVDENGKERVGTRTRGAIRCQISGSKLSQCQRDYQNSYRNPSPGRYTPWCRSDGGYDGLQCYGSNCFCVDSRGNRVSFTSVSISAGDPRCDRYSRRIGLDLAILVDWSRSSWDAARWRGVQYYLRNFVNGLGISPAPRATRVALIGYDSSASVVFNFNHLSGDRINAAEVVRYIDRLSLRDGYRSPVNALRLARTRLFSAARRLRDGSRRAIVMIVGRTIDVRQKQVSASAEASALREMGVYTYVLAADKDVKASEVEEITSKDKIYWSRVDRMDDVRPNILQELVGGQRLHIQDIGFVVDSSSNVNWRQMQQFTLSIVNSFNVYRRGPNFGFISYSDQAYLDFGFDSISWDRLSAREVNSRIGAIQHRRGSGRRIDLALQMANRELFSERRGARKDVRKVNMLI